MITAAIHKKYRTKKMVEDEVTSCIFGEIQHQKPSSIFNFFRELLSRGARSVNTNIDGKLSQYPHTTNVNFEFWRRTGPVEPDLIVHFLDNNRNPFLHIIIEVKWESGLQPKCELVRQWGNKPNVRGDWFHIYLTKDSAKGISDINNSIGLARNSCENSCNKSENDTSSCKISKEVSEFNFPLSTWAKSLFPLGWRDVVAAANTFLSQDLAQGIQYFFEKHRIFCFTQYDWPIPHDSFPNDADSTNFYKRPLWFHYLDNHLEELAKDDLCFYVSPRTGGMHER